MAAQLPLYSHPTVTVLIDDDRSSLVILQHKLEQSIAKKTFSKARQAMEWIAEGFKQAMRIGKPVDVRHADGEHAAASHTIDSELERIYRYIEGPQRFALPAVVVIDYSMPEMDGIQFCRSVRHLPCKKILFTAAGDDRIAIDAFNKGLIHRFVRKLEHTALDELEAGIAELQHDFFVEQSRAQVERLEALTYSFLSDQAVSALVKDLCDRYGYVEYYLLTNPSGFIFFDGHARSTVLVIQTRASLHGQADVAGDAGAPAALVRDLQECRVVPFFQTYDGMWHADAAAQPAEFCKPAQICHGREDYYWALFEPPAHFVKGQPYSHARFLSEHVVKGD